MDQLPQFVKNIGSLGYSLNAISYLLLSLLLIASWKKRLLGGLLLACVIYQVIWSAILAYQAYIHQVPELILLVSEDIRLVIWIVFLMEIFRQAATAGGDRRYFAIAYSAVFGLFVITFALEYLRSAHLIAINHLFSFVFDLSLATFGLILTEQFYRNAKQDKRWSIKFLCIGVGVLFAYDLYMYSHATLFEGINPSLWNARGFVNIVIVPLLAISAARNPKWSFKVFVSRHIVFYSSGLFAIGIYLTVMAIGGYYVQLFGGKWGREAQVIFLVGAIVVLFIILSSGTLRAKAKLFLNKHFYENKYDYREEWMGFIQKLSHIESPRYLKEQILQTVAMIMHSRGALLYLKGDEKYQCMSAWNADTTELSFEEYSSLVSFLNNREWIIDMDEYKDKPQNYTSLQIPEELFSIHSWLIIPLKHYYDLIGFIVLLEPFVKVKINWEDRDLLKAVGKQVSSYVAFMMATESLAEAEKFAAFNRLSAYVVHDMKNSVAQLDLIIKNAEKYKNNPEFIADSFLTVSNVVDRMKRMLNQLKRMDLQKTDAIKLEVNQVLTKIVQKCLDRRPVPEFSANPEELFIYVEPDRFMNVIEHLVTNALDATDEAGKVFIRAKRQDNMVCIEIEDTGCGMSAEFISNHLFKPFDTTKGNAGMGVGVFEAKEFVKYYNGQLNVQSKSGIGTIFSLELPVHNEEITIESKFG
jgi:putative PEP-CTERM system histidine kinase